MTRQDDAGDDLSATGATEDLSSPATDTRCYCGGAGTCQHCLEDAHHAVTMPPDAVEESVEKPEEKPQGRAQFGSMTPSEAARLRWEQVRARRATSELHDDDPDVSTEVRWVRVPIRTGEIIKKLAKDARGGSTQAAKELRAWLSDVARDEENRVSDLDRKTRQQLLDRLLADLEDAADDSSYAPTPATAGTPIA